MLIKLIRPILKDEYNVIVNFHLKKRGIENKSTKLLNRTCPKILDKYF